MVFKQVREIFIFTRKERNGLLVLMFLLFFLVCLDFALPLLIPETVYDVTAWKEEAEKYYEKIPVQAVSEKEIFTGVIDPNSAGLPDLLKMGIPDRIAANWVKYLQKGGRFRKKEEVMKLYGMTGDLYRKVEMNLSVPEKAEPVKSTFDHTKRSQDGLSGYGHKDTLQYRNTVKKDMPLLEINAADSVQLEALPGIGPVLASRIIKYRKLLGGFYSVSQLKEIYGMTEELWTRSSPRLTADSSGMKKLDINFLTVAELGRHPYIGFRQAKKMTKRRDASGKFTRKEELNAIFSTDSLQRLLPYLSISGSGP
jgi:DNA uptake protein ComE-like DNA-binding protein